MAITFRAAMPDESEIVLDDSLLLQDRLLRSFHRNRDGHLAINRKQHIESISSEHNIATLYVYAADDEGYSLHHHYIFTHEPLQYKEWLDVVIRECFVIENNRSDTYYGIYGWLTNHMRITPMRTGDLFIKIDNEGATGVRLAFNTGTNSRDAHKKARQKTRR